MKRIIRILIVSAVAFTTAAVSADAQVLKNLFNKATSSETTEVTGATSEGKAAGAALKALYAQYNVDGKINMGNMTNLINLATLASNVQSLKGQSDKGSFYKDFAAGLILGSDNLVTQNNSTTVMDGLTNLVNNVDMSGLKDIATNVSNAAANTADKANTAVENATVIANSVTNILNLFKK